MCEEVVREGVWSEGVWGCEGGCEGGCEWGV